MNRNTRIVLAFTRLLPLLKQLILGHRYISTDSKDTLINHLDDVLAQLRDASARETGPTIPNTPQTQKFWDKTHKEMFPWDTKYKAKPTT